MTTDNMLKSLTGYTINVRGQLIDLSVPQVMGILNCTPDSFFAGSRKQTEREIADRANEIVAQGASMIDVGAFSTRPGSPEVSEEEEMRRMRFGLEIVRREQPDAVVSVDTFRPDVARMCVEEFGADIINDVSEGMSKNILSATSQQRAEKENAITDQNGCGKAATPHSTPHIPHPAEEDYPALFRMVARLGVPYILMSVRPTLREMMISFAREVQQLRDLGVKDIILDPGFGFGKTLEQNYQILNEMEKLHELGLPLLAGVSRKSMIFRLLNSTPDQSLNGTTVINTLALAKGASILRVHDVTEAQEAVRIYTAMVGQARHDGSCEDTERRSHAPAGELPVTQP